MKYETLNENAQGNPEIIRNVRLRAYGRLLSCLL